MLANKQKQNEQQETKIGERLKEARMSARLSQSELGDRIGVTQSAIAHYERNKNEPDFTTIMTICRVLKIETSWLFADTDQDERRITIMGELQDNGFVLPPKEFKTVIMPPTGLNANLYEAIMVSTHNMPDYRFGDIIYVEKKAVSLVDLAEMGLECLIECENGKVVIRRIAPTVHKTKWTLLSPTQEPISEIEIRLAKPVAWVQRNTEKIK